MERTLPRVEQQNDSGYCWTCYWKGWRCDGGLPRCKTCAERRVRCRGYGVHLQWPANIAQVKPRELRGVRKNATNSSSERSLSHKPSTCFSQMLSSLALPSEDSFFMQHYLQNIARIALAVDYDGNGYRALLPMAMQEPAVLNAALAVAAAHHSRWQQTADSMSRKYLRVAVKALRDRFLASDRMRNPATLASMLLLVSYEVFSGSTRWRGHYDAIRGWIQSRGNCSDLDSFLKTWVCLLDTQSAMNLGLPAMPELDKWLGMEAKSGPVDSIDALFGCSTRLPKIMLAASRLCAAAKQPDSGLSLEEAERQANELQEQLRATTIDQNADPLIGISCYDSDSKPLAATVGLGREQLRQRMVATAEIFRHASHIYVYRIVNPTAPLTHEMCWSLESALQLLTKVPDALGPGANLGWCLVVLGAEIDREDQRDYIRSRWAGLHLLGIYNTKNGQKILEEVWNHRDLVNSGHATPERWQDIMQRIGQSQILV